VNLWEALQEGKRLLTPVSDEPSVDAELLLRHVLNFDRGQLYIRLTANLDRDLELSFQALIDRRLAREPVPYIVGHKEFFGSDFVVSPAALIPRPETELLVEEAIKFTGDRSSDQPVLIADIGTGCGAIAVTLARLLPQARVIATDISKDALMLAKSNALRLAPGRTITFLQGDLLEPLEIPVHLIVANLPYIPTARWVRLPPEIQCEPREALDGGPDGLRAIARLLEMAPIRLKAGGAILLEIGDHQANAVTALARRTFPQGRTKVVKDLARRDRVVALDTRFDFSR
jgi:release factor glutamine methyltransferase